MCRIRVAVARFQASSNCPQTADVIVIVQQR
jgi:hypothetical protein